MVTSKVVLRSIAWLGAAMAIYVAAALQNGPEIADANLCKLLRRFSSAIPDQCLASIDDYGAVAAIIVALGLVVLLLWDFKTPLRAKCVQAIGWWRPKVGKASAKLEPHLILVGLVIALIGLAIIGYGVWKKSLPIPETFASPGTDQPDPSRPSMLSGRKISGLEVVSRLERLEKEHAATVSELAATKEQLETKKQELAAANPTTTLTANATKIRAPTYNRAQIGHIVEAINEFYPIVLDIDKASELGIGITGSMEAIIRDNGATVYLARMDELRLKLNDALDRLRDAKERYGLYQEACRIVEDSNLFSDPFYASWNDLAGVLREIPDNLNARTLSIFVGAKKDTFSTTVNALHEWAARKKQALVENRQFYLQRPTTD